MTAKCKSEWLRKGQIVTNQSTKLNSSRCKDVMTRIMKKISSYLLRSEKGALRTEMNEVIILSVRLQGIMTSIGNDKVVREEEATVGEISKGVLKETVNSQQRMSLYGATRKAVLLTLMISKI